MQLLNKRAKQQAANQPEVIRFPRFGLFSNKKMFNSSYYRMQERVLEWKDVRD